MTTDRWVRIQELFEAALDVELGIRADFVRALSPDDGELAREVLQLLEAHGRELTFLEQAVVGDSRDIAERALADGGIDAAGDEDAGGASGAGTSARSSQAPDLALPAGTRLGPWRIAEVVGEGGMGIVYRAVRAEGGFDQEVALKVVKPGMDSAQILRRFEQERRILAGLQHENIARLLDGGVSDDGRPYVVMEYVRGRAIDVYCDEEQLSLDARLDLFVAVCRAVLHAHSRLIVHRDLKPANILVTEDGVPKLLDFGIARLLDDDEAGTRLTQAGLRILTPDYAAPEQHRGDAIGTPADIYALGVILYELLVGERPPATDADGTTRPTRPSAAPALTTDAERARAIGRARRLAPDKLRRRLSGDLDVICLKALRAEPERRYPTADALADDLERHRRGLPVTARRDTLGYRISRFVSRNKAAVSAAAMGAALLIGTSTFYTVRLAEERDLARIEAERATQVSDFLAELFETEEGETTARTLLDRGAERLEADLADQPDVLARLREVVGRAYLAIGEDQEAVEMFTAALDAIGPVADDAPADEQIDYTKVESRVAMALVSVGAMNEAIEVYESILDRRARLLDVHADLADAHYQLAGAYMYVEREPEAAEQYQAAIDILHAREAMGVELGEPLRVTYRQLGSAYYWHREESKNAEAIAAYRTADSIAEALYGAIHPTRLEALFDLAWAVRTEGDDEAFEDYLMQAEAMGRELYEEGSIEQIDLLLELASAHSGAAQRARATELYLEGADQAATYLGATHQYVDRAYSGLAELLIRLRRYEESIPYAERTLEIVNAREGSMNNLSARWNAYLGRNYMFLEDFERAIPYFAEAAAIRAEIGHPALANTLEGLGTVQRSAGRVPEAIATFERILELSDDPVETARAESRMGDALVALGDTTRAIGILERVIPVLEEAYPEDHPVPEAARRYLRQAKGEESGG